MKNLPLFTEERQDLKYEWIKFRNTTFSESWLFDCVNANYKEYLQFDYNREIFDIWMGYFIICILKFYKFFQINSNIFFIIVTICSSSIWIQMIG